MKRKLELARLKYATKRRKITHHPIQSREEAVTEKRERKKGKLTADDLQWKPVARPRHGGELGVEGAMLMLEEIDGVNVVYGDQEKNREEAQPSHYFQVGSSWTCLYLVADRTIIQATNSARLKANVPEKSAATLTSKPEVNDQLDDTDCKPAPQSPLSWYRGNNLRIDTALLPDWSSLPLHQAIKRALHIRKFTTPTRIQTQAIPLALSGRDVIGVAETVRLPISLPPHQSLTHSLSRDPERHSPTASP